MGRGRRRHGPDKFLRVLVCRLSPTGLAGVGGRGEEKKTYTRWHVIGATMAVGLQPGLVGASVCLELVVLAYVEVVGWFIVAMTLVYGILTAVFIIGQTPQLGTPA